MRDVDTILNILYLFWCRTCKFRNTRHVRFYPQWSWPLVLTWNSWSLAGWVVYQGSFLSISAYILSMTGSCSVLKMFFSPCSYTYNMISILNWSLLSYQYKATAASDAWTFNYFLTKNTSICKSPMVNLGWSWLRWIKTNLEVKLRALLRDFGTSEHNTLQISIYWFSWGNPIDMNWRLHRRQRVITLLEHPNTNPDPIEIICFHFGLNELLIGKECE